MNYEFKSTYTSRVGSCWKSEKQCCRDLPFRENCDYTYTTHASKAAPHIPTHSILVASNALQCVPDFHLHIRKLAFGLSNLLEITQLERDRIQIQNKP